jgi:hypothetical protein
MLQYHSCREDPVGPNVNNTRNDLASLSRVEQFPR